MNDFILIDNLVVFANHGVLDEEKTMGQKFIISIKLYTDTKIAAKTDDISKAVNYAEVCLFVTEFTKNNRCKLIETAVSDIADAILMKYLTVDSVEVTLKKPWAPIGLPLDKVAVTIHRARHIAYIGAGSNIGDTKSYLDFAVSELSDDKRCSNIKAANYIVTKPVGGVEQDDFLNTVIELKTLYSPQELLERLQEIENAAGRTRTIHWGPRTLDLDLLLYDDNVIHTETLTVPHPEMAVREFVLAPLCEIAPYAYHPVEKEYASVLLRRISHNGTT